MRIISGFLKSRKLKGYNLTGTRPTMDKVRESVFSIIQGNVKDSIVLDLFAGSGSLGIEAISNGATIVYFVDKNLSAVKVIKSNIKTLDIEDKSVVMLRDYKSALKCFKKEKIKFDLIFLDPPYDLDVIEHTLKFIDENSIISDSGQVICEFEKDHLLEQYGDLKCIKSRKYGNKNIKIYQITK